MKIGIVSTWFERGAAYVSKQYEIALAQQGHDVFIYARGGEAFAKGDPEWDKDNVYWQKDNNFPIFNYVNDKEFEAWLDKNNIETVIFNEQIWFEPVILCKNKKIKVGAYIDYYTEPMIKCFDIYDFLLCNTKRHLKAFEKHKNAYFIQWGTDVDLFCPQEILSDEIIFFHSCGMNSHRKGTDLLLKAFLNLEYKEIEKSKLIIHTQLPEERLIEALSENERKICSNLISKEKIELISKTVTAPGLYHLGHVYVYPSRLDGLGLTVAEAKSCGMPLIVPNDGPMNEFIQEGIDLAVSIEKLFSRYDGYYWPQNEVKIDELSNALSFYIENYKKSMRLDSRKFALDNLNWFENSKKLDVIISNVISNEVDIDVINYCKSFNEKKFPKIYRYKKIYQLLFKFYKKVK
ncbi:glycosyltransferase [Photobacterium leiognathi]|uniref:glycosyltransferase n=1 Tax=Photobacterium leiognathi TaxID=553611 RepID=UPI0029828D95|nr:glycosyltransferase [Photobacterium leiognathi]